MFRNLRDDLDSLPRKVSLFAGRNKQELEIAVQENVDKIIESLFNCKYVNSDTSDSKPYQPLLFQS
jgi:hypothetical protein